MTSAAVASANTQPIPTDPSTPARGHLSPMYVGEMILRVWERLQKMFPDWLIWCDAAGNWSASTLGLNGWVTYVAETPNTLAGILIRPGADMGKPQ